MFRHFSKRAVHYQFLCYILYTLLRCPFYRGPEHGWLSHRQPASAETSWGTCRAQWHDRRDKHTPQRQKFRFRECKKLSEFHYGGWQNSWFLGCDTAWSCRTLQPFRRTAMHPSSSGHSKYKDFQVFTAMGIHTVVFRILTPCSLVGHQYGFGLQNAFMIKIQWVYNFRSFTKVSFQIMERYVAGDYRRFGSSILPLSSRSILKPLKLTNSLCQLSDVPVLDPPANAIFK